MELRKGVDYGRSFDRLLRDMKRAEEIGIEDNYARAFGYLIAGANAHIIECTEPETNIPAADPDDLRQLAGLFTKPDQHNALNNEL